MNIDERFEKLEKQIKNLKKMLGGVATLALAALIGGTALGVHAANGSFDTLTAKTLHLKDSSGKTRVSLYGSNGNLLLKDASGKDRVALYGSNGYLYLKDASGKNSVMLYGSSGSISSGNLYLNDSSGKQRVALSGSSGKLDLKDASGKTRVMLYGSSGSIKAVTISAAHKHTAFSSSARKKANRHSHKLTVN
jgi:DUF4097 and DUF4098 domain-containing protein YvlB